VTPSLATVLRAVLVAIVLCGCSGPRAEVPGERRPAAAASPTTALPAGCEIERAAATVTAFLTAYNSGDDVILEDHFAPVHKDRKAPHYLSRGFQWFADNGGLEPDGFQTYWPGPRLKRYIEGLQAVGDRQELAELYVNAYDRRRDWASFAIMVHRERDDLARNLSLGKGALRCHDMRMTLWNMGPTGSGEDHPGLCDYDATPDDEAILCVR
jgi:hypothetical protein